MLVGYARVSSAGQSLEVQLEALSAAGCEKVMAEKRSGSSTDGRDALKEALEFVREGDTCLAFWHRSPSSKQTSGASVSVRESTEPRRLVSTRVAKGPLTGLRCVLCS